MECHGTEQEFITAFWKLYEEKPIEKISVQQLCRTAGYNRSTFYNHFTDIYDLQDKAVDSVFRPTQEEVFAIGDFRLFMEGTTAETIVSSYFLIEDKYIELLFRRHAEYLIGDKIKKNFLRHIREQARKENADFETIELILEYQISAALGVVKYWYRQGKTIPAKEMLNKVFDISLNGAFRTLKAELDKVYGDVSEV